VLFSYVKVDIGRANEFNLCKLVVDELHNHLSAGKYTRGCLLYCMVSSFFLISIFFYFFSYFCYEKL
jgi:hypothetical protein